MQLVVVATATKMPMAWPPNYRRNLSLYNRIYMTFIIQHIMALIIDIIVLLTLCLLINQLVNVP